jgi:hypothetical protein
VTVDLEAERRTVSPRSRAPWPIGLRLAAAGVLILQLAWIFAVPPFRGSDEFDHVYRAAAAARGQWLVTPAAATRGTGAWLDVPNDIVAAARPQCVDLQYTRAEDCYGTPGEHTTRIASGAGRYNPVFYGVVGTVALPFDGLGALYAMRLATVLLTWSLFCLALAAARRWARTAWPTSMIALASTPVLLYSSSIVAPNGVELMAALVVWTATLGLLRNATKPDTLLTVAAAVGGCILVTTRSLGPLWCVLILVSAYLTTRPAWSDLKALLLRRSSVAAAAVVTVATALNVAWILGMDALNIGQTMSDPITLGHRLRILLENELLWSLQSIAAFPLRDEATRMPVYACYLVLFAGMVYLGFRYAGRQERLALAATILLAACVPFALNLDPHTFPNYWQGRYGLPYSLGIALVVGVVLDNRRRSLGTDLRLVVLALFAVAQAIGPMDVLLKGVHHPLSDYAHFPHPPAALVVCVAAVGAALLWWGASSTPSEAER